MLLTRQQASETWCPMVRVGVLPSHGGPTALSDPGSEFHGNCISAGCMMWRWHEPESVVSQRVVYPEDALPEDGSEPPRPPSMAAVLVWYPLDGEDGGCWMEPLDHYNERVERSASSRRGFCGLAQWPAHG